MRDRTFIPTEELNQHDYRFVVRRNSPEPTGWVGTFYGEDLIACEGFIEEAVQNFFGGGRYSVKIYEDAVPQPGVVRVSIYGAPKEESRKEKKESQIEKLKKEIERRESQREKESQQKFHELRKEGEIEKLREEIKKLKSQIEKEAEPKFDGLKDEPSESALEKMLLAFSEAFTEEDETVNFMEQLFSKTKTLAVDVIKEVKTEKEPKSETIAEIKDVIDKNQSQINDINLRLFQQDSKINQLKKAANSIIQNRKKERRERLLEAQKQKQSNDSFVWILGLGVTLYNFSPEFKEFVDGLIGKKDKANQTNTSSQREVQQVDTSG